MSIATLDTDVLPEIEDDVTPPDGKAHYVRKKAILSGGPVVALCGKKYVPIEGFANPNRKTCAPCAELYELLKSMD